jgi:hypothetical protein
MDFAPDISECCCKPVCYTIEKELLTMQLITNLQVSLEMAELALVDYFVMGEAIGIVATLCHFIIQVSKCKNFQSI